MPSILIALPIDYSSVILADKLRMSSENDVCLYIDSQINDKFQKQALEGLKFVGSTVRSTSDKVLLWFMHHFQFFNQDWKEFDYVVFSNLNIQPQQTDSEYSEMIVKLFR